MEEAMNFLTFQYCFRCMQSGFHLQLNSLMNDQPIEYLYDILLSYQIMGSKPNKKMFFHNDFSLCDTMHEIMAKGVC